MKRLATAALAAATALTISTVPALAADDKEGSSLADTINSKSGESSLSSDDKSGEKGSSSLTDKSGDIKLSSDDKSGEKGSSSLTDKSGDIKLSSDNESDKDSNRNLLIGLGILAALIGAFNFAMQSGVLPFKI
ncbi:hypothetical protein [Corynebacterium glaucum]|uniref:hypothetical protein n=1 Tax=Corynebacterium glaucum TaxID=187491 RepID=UPI00265AA5A5|nr:hypothetical protein [Corynebacterium glaucum]